MLGSSEVRGKASLDTVFEMGKNDFCVAYGCNHHRAYGATCTFFTFPEDPEYFQRWTNACKRDVVYESGKRTKWTPSEYQKLCSCHFENDRCPDPKSRKPGNKNKIPTIFSHKARTCNMYIFTYAITKIINKSKHVGFIYDIQVQSRNITLGINMTLACACFLNFILYFCALFTKF